MADDLAVLDAAATTKTVAADDIGGVLHQRVKIRTGTDGSGVDVSTANPMPVSLANTGANATPVVVSVPAGVDVNNTPDVNVANTPDVNVANTPNVAVTNTPKVEPVRPGDAIVLRNRTVAGGSGATMAKRIKATAARLYGWSFYNDTTLEVHVVLYNSAASPPVPGTTAIEDKFMIPPMGGNSRDFGPSGVPFDTGLGIAFVTGPTDADVTGPPTAGAPYGTVYYS